MSARGGLENSCGSILLFKMDNQDGLFLERPANLLAEDQVSHLRTLLSAQSNFESRLRQDVRSIMASIMREDGQVDIVVLASRLVLIGYKVSIRTAVGGGSGQECFRNLNYEFLLVSQSGSEAKELIVDARFREQFKLSQQTHRYSQLLNLLPEAFVGQHSMIVHLVKLLASEMETAFSETGITMPPWRQAGSMMSKWKPLKSKDTEVSSPRLGGASPSGALSLCSSRSSSSCSDCSPQRLRPLVSGGLQRVESIPMRIQSGFNLESRPASEMRDGRVQKASRLEFWPQNSLCTCNGLTSKDNHDCPKGVLQKNDFRMPQAGFSTGACKENLGLAKIRTVKLGVR